MAIDKIDYLILNELIRNARESASNIADSIGMSVPAVTERIKKLPVVNSDRPGLKTIIAPIKPTTVAVQRRLRITSPSRITAAIDENKGVVKLNATASANGISLSP